jgi:hypothetical protein
MVKKRTGGASRFKASKDSHKQEEERQGPTPPAHVQRKLARKVKFLDRVASSKVKALAAVKSLKKRTQRKKKVLPSLDTLAESLRLVDAAAQQETAKEAGKPDHTRVTSAKGRMHAVAKESSRLQQVLSHPQFQANPLLAITNHLNASLPPPPAQPKHPQQSQKRKRKGKSNGGNQASATMEED